MIKKIYVVFLETQRYNGGKSKNARRASRAQEEEEGRAGGRKILSDRRGGAADLRAGTGGAAGAGGADRFPAGSRREDGAVLLQGVEDPPHGGAGAGHAPGEHRGGRPGGAAAPSPPRPGLCWPGSGRPGGRWRRLPGLSWTACPGTANRIQRNSAPLESHLQRGAVCRREGY